MKKLSLILTLFLFVLGTAMAQRTVSGVLTDDAGEPLIGANILVKGTTAGTVTDIDGKYTLRVPEGYDVLVVSYTGYESQEITLGASNVVDVTMTEGITLSEAVVTALGIQREEKALGYAVQEVDGDEVLEANTVSVVEALSGKAAGVFVNQSSGAAGASSRIVLRGQTSFNGSNQALIVIDGVRLDNSEENSERGLYGVANSNRGIDINPNDVESVTVLKGASATALYGVEGARGVVLITTKKGKSGEGIGVDFGANLTFSERSQIVELQDKYAQGFNGGWLGPETGWLASWGPLADTLYWDGSDYDYDKNGRIVGQSDPNRQAKFEPYDNVDDLYQTGVRWNTSVALTGGSDVINWRLSLGHMDEEGIVPKNTFDRSNVGIAFGARPVPKLDISGSINYIHTAGRRIQQGSNTSGLNLGLFRTPISFDNSNGFSDAEDQPTAYQFPDGRQRNYRGGGGYDNPFWVVNLSPFFDNVNRMFGSVKATYEFSKWFALGTTIGSDFYTDNRKQEFEIGSRTFPGGQVFEDQYNYRHTDIYFNLLGGDNVGSSDFSINYNVGVNMYNEQKKQNYAQGDGLGFIGFRELSNTKVGVSRIDHVPFRTFSTFASVDFGFKNMVYLTLTGRNDWISTLINPNREFKAGDIDVFYPSASLSFVFSELMNNNSVLTFGKLRASYAEVGGGAPNPFLTSTNFILPNQLGLVTSLADGWTNGILFPLNNTLGYTFDMVKGNPDLIPSRTKDFEIGADLRFLKNRLGLDASYYIRNSVDQIIPVQVASSTGHQRAVFNSGELETKGVELVLRGTPVQSNTFSWDVSVNFSHWNTLVKSLPEGVPNQYIDGFTGSAIYNIAPEDTDGDGNPDTEYEYGQIYGNPFQRANTPDGKSFDPNLPYNPDGALIIDDSGDPTTNANYGYPLVDPIQRVIGNPNPDFLMGITNTLTWKGLSFSFLWDIKEGGDIWNGTKGALTFFGMTELTENRDLPGDYENTTNVFDGILASNGAVNTLKAPLDQWWYLGNGGGFGSVSEHFVEDGSYHKLRYARLGYNFGDMVNGLDDLTLSVTGRNLVIITDYTGFDPELSLIGSGNGQGLDYFQMPSTRSVTIGINARF